MARTFCKMNPLNPLRFDRETEKNVYFFNFTKLQFLSDKIYSYTKKSYIFGTWQFGQIGFSAKSYAIRVAPTLECPVSGFLALFRVF